MTAFLSLFSDTYFTARHRFLRAAAAKGHEIETAIHPLSGDFPAEVATDTVRIGPDKARHVLFISSGLHGTELTTGSGIQLGLIEEIESWLPGDMAAIFIHAVNPHGSASMTRTDENNVDPNRNNLVSFDPLPDNPDYDALHDALCPAVWEDPERDEAEARIAAYIAENGFGKFSRNVLAGQYSHPDGLFYGGSSRSWTIANLADTVARHGAGAERLAIVDLHTGLGEYGALEVMRRDAAPREGAASSKIRHVACDVLDDVACPAPPIKVILEFGTFPIGQVVNCHRADTWLKFYGHPHTPLGRKIKAELRDALFCDDPAWLEAVYSQGIAATRAVLNELSDTSAPTAD
ncbi:M14 family metallopeptidase [Nisaea acidiphila]|uniref:M14 family metallopeptidase n=1 Tax=Nisaea acidiphila TaxID=1862145 RepID=A0A9J7AUD7_9PROT|nr:M14 family metallopeptidase [Nisaea acidiphila]UUX50726.1 M14 family metallopeptidase [Nisaea acidiphila]